MNLRILILLLALGACASSSNDGVHVATLGGSDVGNPALTMSFQAQSTNTFLDEASTKINGITLKTCDQSQELTLFSDIDINMITGEVNQSASSNLSPHEYCFTTVSVKDLKLTWQQAGITLEFESDEIKNIKFDLIIDGGVSGEGQSLFFLLDASDLLSYADLRDMGQGADHIILTKDFHPAYYQRVLRKIRQSWKVCHDKNRDGSISENESALGHQGMPLD